MKPNLKLLFFSLLSPLMVSSATVWAQDNTIEDAQVSELRPNKMSEEQRKEMRKEMRKKHRKHRKGKQSERLEELDTNQDDKVDLGEFLANAEKRFNELDANSDGYVTKEEARNRHRELREKHKEMRKQMREKHLNEMEESDL